MKTKLLAALALALSLAASAPAQVIPPLDVKPTPKLVYKIIDEMDQMASAFEQAAIGSRKYAALFPDAREHFLGAAETYEEAARKVRLQITRAIEALAATAEPALIRRPEAPPRAR